MMEIVVVLWMLIGVLWGVAGVLVGMKIGYRLGTGRWWREGMKEYPLWEETQ